MKWLLRFLALALLASTITTSLVHPTAHAVTANDWQAGRIIDDGIFSNSGDMSVSDIQNFLNTQVPNCDTNGTQPATEYGRSDLTHAQYAASRGWPAPPYVCLRDFYEVPKTAPGPGIPANNFSGTIPAGAISAAQIIYNAAQQSQINPKVLLVMIQKESSGPLTTDTWPLQSQYTYAMGAHCPDTAPCDANYAGFSIQVSESAGLLRWYLDSMTQSWWQYKKPGINSILYSPTTSCGSSNVNITTSATAALYTYTPYQPNAAALANMYGLGDSCSAYGNRNFWRIYNDWFTATYSPSFQAKLYSQSPYPSLRAGQVANVRMSYVNIGTVLWTDDSSAAAMGQYPVHLATAGPTNRISAFSATWPSGGRPAVNFTKVYNADGTTLASNQHIVNPGQIGEYDFSFTAPVDYPPGSYQESFFPVREGTSSWFMGGLSWLNVTVQPTTFAATFTGQSPFPTIAAGSNYTSYFDFKNTGTGTWYDESSKPVGIAPVRLATYMPINHPDLFGAAWPTSNRPNLLFSKVFESDGVTLAADQHVVQTGQIARFSFSFTTPVDTSPSMYREFFTPVLEGSKNWNIGNAAWQDVTVTPTTWTAGFVGQSPYPTIAKGTSTNAYFKIKNTGSGVWYDSASAPIGIAPVHLATINPINRVDTFASGWVTSSRPTITFSKVYEADGSTLASNQHTVLPGQMAEFDFSLSAATNATSGTYREYFAPILEGAGKWNMGFGMWLDVTVQ